ncbi:hypothetical protein ECANGB1_2063 [Enterospora canceri]|uniref:Uncharacterized protein n=1 Tax=Enterospora canceri TaxID=1081671 RepID=A0A1Y1S8T8_9MICR|nr:hypothetical protein ECANGB1_2063 [Enterospora canceri]
MFQINLILCRFEYMHEFNSHSIFGKYYNTTPFNSDDITRNYPNKKAERIDQFMRNMSGFKKCLDGFFGTGLIRREYLITQVKKLEAQGAREHADFLRHLQSCKEEENIFNIMQNMRDILSNRDEFITEIAENMIEIRNMMEFKELRQGKMFTDLMSRTLELYYAYDDKLNQEQGIENRRRGYD